MSTSESNSEGSVWKEVFHSFTNRWLQRFERLPQLQADIRSGVVWDSMKRKFLEVKESVEANPYPTAAYVVTFATLYGHLLWKKRAAQLEEARIRRTFQEVKDRQAREKALQKLREQKLDSLSAEEIERLRKKKIEEEIKKEKEQLADISRS
ncbi:hypothetical protein Gasu2_45000 [Galdieria sulphuraria]|uniref:Uncharacterized protein n=1 Tax=Galdieria sulphuraria TaxID=130081 RepID=M2Y7J5_GALSU|nr:uncharacterized protein Gasu_08780 [Galdieria sulphuraria]EME31799.1 hypothetical protein Gasu_08780 [Galdieria sulphuraria]GJD10303.1 hypothetical protein Gasu2_45000 [Galdieria sulphuraria]|eukprot:XP_005708319.1 hypothetical protein Gasu_08780 [Galdieria sulphuraria]